MAGSILRVALVTTAVLLVPFGAMLVTDEADWDAPDFVIVGALVAGAGLLYELVIRRVRSTAHRALLAAALAVLLLLAWIELAVGLFGTPIAGS